MASVERPARSRPITSPSRAVSNQSGHLGDATVLRSGGAAVNWPLTARSNVTRATAWSKTASARPASRAAAAGPSPPQSVSRRTRRPDLLSQAPQRVRIGQRRVEQQHIGIAPLNRGHGVRQDTDTAGDPVSATPHHGRQGLTEQRGRVADGHHHDARLGTGESPAESWDATRVSRTYDALCTVPLRGPTEVVSPASGLRGPASAEASRLVLSIPTSRGCPPRCRLGRVRARFDYLFGQLVTTGYPAATAVPVGAAPWGVVAALSEQPLHAPPP